MPMVACADAVVIDGIYYNLVSKNDTYGAEVTSNPNKYTGNIVIPDTVLYDGMVYSVRSIGDYSFSDCTRLSAVNIPSSVSSIGKEAFYNCTMLTSINIPSSVTSIDKDAFRWCKNLKAVYITDLEAWCSITFPDRYSIESNPLFYAHHLFLNNVEIKDLVIPSSITKINSFAFIGCSGLSSLTLHQNVASIGYSAFYGCSNLSSLFIPDSVVTIGNYAFEKCSSVTSLRLPKDLQSIGEFTFYECKELQSITWPINLSNIERAAFAGCSSLITLSLPESVINIKEDAFNNCANLTTVVIGKSIRTLEERAFGYCPELKDVYCYSNKSVPTTNAGAFSNSYIEYANLHVPVELVDAYQVVDPWKNFKEIVALTESDPQPNTSGICFINNFKDNKIVIYNINGVLQNAPKKGFNIINGKKIIIK